VKDLILKGEIKTPCHLYIGEEAAATGVCLALEKEDYIFGNHRSHGHYIAKGGDIKKLMAEIFCRNTGCSGGKGGSMHIVAPEVGLLGTPPILAASIPLAVGTALSSVLRNNNRVSVSFFGDGAVNEGTFYEALNFASLKKLPVIFVCENNFYSTHMPISKCLADTNIAKKAQAFGMEGLQVNGNDVLEVFQTAKKLVEESRKGNGPALMEVFTYRWLGHVGAHDDLDKGLRSKEELEEWQKKCPIKSFEKFLAEEKLLAEAERKQVCERIDKEIEEAVVFAKNSPFPGGKELISDVFKV